MALLRMLVPNEYVFAGSWGYTRRWLILHKTAGFQSAQAVAAYFQAGAPQPDGSLAEVSAHYVVGQNIDEIVQCVSENDGAGANGILEPGHDPWWSGNPNLITFSIEHVDPSPDNSTPLTSAQKQSSFALVYDICTRWNIPMRPADENGGITGHYSISPQSRSRCPGDYPWDELWTYLKGVTPMPIPQGWTDDGTALWPPDKAYKVVAGFRSYIKDSGSWDAGNVPRMNEAQVAQVELHANTGAGSHQIFRDGMLVWIKATGRIATTAAGDEIKACYDLIAQLKAQLAAKPK